MENLKIIGKIILILVLIIWAAASTFLSYVLFNINKQSAISFSIAEKSLNLVKDKIKYATSSDKSLKDAIKGFEKVKDDYQDHLYVHKYDLEGYKKTVAMTNINKILYAWSVESLQDIENGKKDLAESIKITKTMYDFQVNGLKRAKRMQEVSKKLLPYTETMAKLLK